MTRPFTDYEIPGFRGMVTYTGSERLSSGTLKETSNVYNKVAGDLTPRPGLADSDNITGVTNAPITLFFYQRFNKFAPQGGDSSGAQSNTTAFSVAGTNTNPGYTTGTQSSGLSGGAGAGGVIKHQHSADTNAQGGHLIEATKVADSTANAIVGTLSDIMSVGTDENSNDKLRVSKEAIEQYLVGAVDEVAGYDKRTRPDIIGKIKTADIADGATGTVLEVDSAGAQLGTVEHTGTLNDTGGIAGLNSYWNVGFDWKNTAYLKGQRII